ncbi:MAG: response regulator, partial [Planctomycetes bacterium]|nr:response regulator [Planctomycetota bacterium]
KGDRERCLAAGMDGYLAKPVQAQHLIGEVERLAQGAEPVQEAFPETPRPPSATVQTAVVFDRSEAIAKCFDSRDMLRRMVRYFFDEYEELLPRMRNALEKGDLDVLGHLGHRLKGTVAYLGAQPATEAARGVEQLCNGYDGTQTNAEEAVNTLEQQCRILKAALSEQFLADE